MMKWPWVSRRAHEAALAAERIRADKQSFELGAVLGMRKASEEDILAIEGLMAGMPDYAKNSLHHLAGVVVALRRLQVQRERRSDANAKADGQDRGGPGGRAPTGPEGPRDAGGAAGQEARGAQGAARPDRLGGGAKVQPAGGMQRPDQSAQEAPARAGL